MVSPGGRRSSVVTGGGTGLGRELVLGLARRDYQVFGTAMSKAEADEVVGLACGRATMIVCDVTSRAAVIAFAARVSSVLLDDGLDVLISNAATITPGPLEVLSIDSIRHEFEVNVFGGLSMINALLPDLRRARARGRIIHIGSRAAMVPMPFNGPCGASKAAMDVFADVYRAELRTSGVDFVVAVPGGMRTSGLEAMRGQLAAVLESMDASQRSLYAVAFDRFTRRVQAAPETALDAADAAARVIELAEQRPAPIRVAIGIEAEQAFATARSLSEVELDEQRLRSIGLV